METVFSFEFAVKVHVDCDYVIVILSLRYAFISFQPFYLFLL